jgi:hypothetical protein
MGIQFTMTFITGQSLKSKDIADYELSGLIFKRMAQIKSGDSFWTTESFKLLSSHRSHGLAMIAKCASEFFWRSPFLDCQLTSITYGNCDKQSHLEVVF